MTLTELDALLDSFREKNVLVVGDSIDDVSVQCRVRGLSAETPTLVVEEVSRGASLGGAGCVYRNLAALGAKVKLYSNGPRPSKLRYWADGYKLLQIDNVKGPFPIATLQQFCVEAGNASIVVVADYRHGFISQDVARSIVQSVNKEVPLFVASQVSQESSNHPWYNGRHTNFVLNEREWKSAVGVNAKRCIITLGAEGSMDANTGARCAGIGVKAVDTCGAGDAFLAAYALTEDMAFANLWAGLSTEVQGANPPTIERLREWVRAYP